MTTPSIAPRDRPRFFFSVGMKLMLFTASFLVLSFILYGMSMVSFARRTLRSQLEEKVSRDTRLLSAVSAPLLESGAAGARPRLTENARELIKDPAILAVTIMNSRHQVVAQAAKPVAFAHPPFSFLLPIRSNQHTVGWIRAWFSPGLAFEQIWQLGGDMAVVLLCGTLGAFGLIFMVVNEWILARPFKKLIEAIDQAAESGKPLEFSVQRRDEWGLLGERLNAFLNRVVDLQQQSAVLYESSRLLGMPSEFQATLEGVLSGFLYRHALSSCVVFAQVNEAELRVKFSAGISSGFAEALSVRTGQGPAGSAYSSGSLRLIQNIPPNEPDPMIHEMIKRQQARSALLIPMVVEGRPWGLAAYFSRKPDHFSEALVQSLSVFTQQLGLAVRNARLMSQMKETSQGLEIQVAATAQELTQTNQRLMGKVRELKTIYDLALATAASNNVEEIVKVIVNSVKELVDVQTAAFFLYDKNTGDLEPLSPAFDRASEAAQAFRANVQDSPLLKAVIGEGQAQVLNFIEPGEPLPPSWAAVSMRSLLVLPLRQNEAIEGLFCVVNKLNGLFSDDDVRLLSLLTNRVTEVLRRLELDQELRQKVQDLSILQEIATHLPSPPVLGDTVATIGRIARQVLPGLELCLFFLYQAETEALLASGGDWISELNFDAKAMNTGASEKTPLADVFRLGRPAHSLDNGGAAWDKDGLKATLALQDLFYVPLIAEQRTIGVMAIASRTRGAVTPEHRRLAGLIAEQVAVIVERSRLYERLRAANEKLEQINHLKNEFISMVSHELRTPLTTMKGFVSIVLNEETGALNKQQRHFLETSDRAIDRLTLLVSDLLDISRIEAGQIQMQLRPVTLKEVVERIIANFEPQVKAHHLILNIDIPESLPLIMADPHRLTQVFDNLLSNALKFTTEGSITLTAIDKGDFVLVSVKDTGIGIPKQEQDHIFEKFYQIKVGGAYPSKGTGLGLAIVRSIIESHRGKVWVESDSGKGADFRFILPRARLETSGGAAAGMNPGALA